MIVATRGASKTGKPDESKETEAKVSDYPERSYADAITDEQREALKAHGVTVAEASTVSEAPAE